MLILCVNTNIIISCPLIWLHLSCLPVSAHLLTCLPCNSQQDAHEFFTDLLAALAEEMHTRLRAFLLPFLPPPQSLLPQQLITGTSKGSSHCTLFPFGETAPSADAANAPDDGWMAPAASAHCMAQHAKGTTAEGRDSSELFLTAAKAVKRAMDSPGVTQQSIASVEAPGIASKRARLSEVPRMADIVSPDPTSTSISTPAPTAAMGMTSTTMMMSPELLIADDVLPVAQQLQSMVSMRFQCAVCGHRREPKLEAYQHFSLDLPNEPTAVGTAAATGMEYGTATDTVQAQRQAQGQIPLPPLQLEQLLGGFFGEDLRVMNCVQCSASKGGTTTAAAAIAVGLEGKCHISSKLHPAALPQTLVLQLKRFRYNPEAQTYEKVSRRVRFPLLLDLARCGCLDASAATDATVAHPGGISFQKPMCSRAPAAGLWQNAPDELVESPECLSRLLACLGECATAPSLDTVAGSTVSAPTAECIGGVGGGIRGGGVESAMYHLTAVLRHQGKQSTMGHFVCDVLTTAGASEEPVTTAATANAATATSSYTWKRYNDSIVTDISEVSQVEVKPSCCRLFVIF